MKNIRSANVSAPVIKRSIDESGNEKIFITGYAITFNQRSRTIYDFWGDEFQEEIKPQALENCDLSEVVATFNHEDNKHLASTYARTLTLRVDETGLYYELETPNTSYASDMIKLIEAGEVRGNSFEFIPKKIDWRYDKEGSVYVRDVHQIDKLYAINPVFSPAYPTSKIISNRAFDGKEFISLEDYRQALRKRFIY